MWRSELAADRILAVRFVVIACAGLWMAFLSSVGAVDISQRAGEAKPARPVPRLVMIHGRDQTVGTKSQVEEAWNRAIDQGLQAARSRVPIARDQRRFLWYADLLASSGCRFGVGAGESYIAAGWSVMPTLRDLLAGLAGQLPTGLQRSAVERLMEDTAMYLGNGAVACAVDEALKAEWEKIPNAAPVVVVAHSMGSMILYKNLRNKLESSGHPVYLLTIGSMVGNQTVQKTLLGSVANYPAPVPLPVVWWRNFINDGDHLAFLAAKSFASETPAKRPIDVPLKAGPTEPHAATSYLASPTFGRALGTIWCELAADQECNR